MVCPRSIFVLLFTIIAIGSQGQSKYWVFLADKDSVEFDPYAYFDPLAIERRINQGIPLVTFTDLPVRDSYIGMISKKVDSIIAISRWLNALVVVTNEDIISDINTLGFVINSNLVVSANLMTTGHVIDTIHRIDSAILIMQTERMKGSLFAKKDIDGSGIRIAIFDTGFPWVDTHPAFEHIMAGSKIIGVYDFVKNKEPITSPHSHGSMVLSNIAGKYGDLNLGLATGAEFLLARTERLSFEISSEEYFWVMAAEWADKNGAHIINSSLGYSWHRYFQEDMNGKVSMIAKGAEIASSKGMLVVNSSGNEDNNRWKTIVTPGDNSQVLTIGGTDPYTDLKIGFSSTGPASDGTLKPNVSASGHTIVAMKSGYGNAFGTSFSSPLVVGFAACAWQMNPDWSNTELFTHIEQSGHLYPYFDYAHGYGIPQADYFTEPEGSPIVQRTFIFQSQGDSIAVILNNKFFEGKEDNINYNLFYHFRNKDGTLAKYGAIKIIELANKLLFARELFSNEQRLFIHFEGFTDSYTLE